ncbi:TPT-domain-containing protein [Gloeopeniophorella convolvens]|nr:TPT-domain-containing protein [Gloeopeniophorella convolvens]
MASEKFFENGGRPIDIQTAHFLNAKPEGDPTLPSPVSTPAAKQQQQQQRARFSAAAIIPVWIILSSAVIIYNNYLYNSLNSSSPSSSSPFTSRLLSAIGTRVLQRTTHLLDGAKDVHLSKEMFARSILPIGLLFSASLILSNTAYLYLSVAYIQMLKAFTPVAILLISWTFRIQEPNRKLALIVVMISSGVALASHGEMRFNLVGFLTQAAAVAFEASRLVMIQILLHGLKMDPLVSLHYYAPVCAVINLAILPFTEGMAPFYELARIGPLVLISNAAVAFCLNVAAVFLDILLITGSVLIFGSPIAPLQVFGYSIALGGLIFFKTSGSK